MGEATPHILQSLLNGKELGPDIPFGAYYSILIISHNLLRDEQPKSTLNTANGDFLAAPPYLPIIHKLYFDTEQNTHDKYNLTSATFVQSTHNTACKDSRPGSVTETLWAGYWEPKFKCERSCR